VVDDSVVGEHPDTVVALAETYDVSAVARDRPVGVAPPVERVRPRPPLK
jgi:hypothetical protein